MFINVHCSSVYRRFEVISVVDLSLDGIIFYQVYYLSIQLLNMVVSFSSRLSLSCKNRLSSNFEVGAA